MLGEVLSDQLTVIMEYVKDIPYIKNRVGKLEEDMKDVKSDIKVIKAVVIDIDRQQQGHEKRLTRLEAV